MVRNAVKMDDVIDTRGRSAQEEEEEEEEEDEKKRRRRGRRVRSRNAARG